MKLEKKKGLIARTLGVGKKRITLNKERLTELKDVITKQDVRDLLADKAIILKEVSGRKKIVKRKTRRRSGSIKKKVKGGKTEYVLITRKLRAYIKRLKDSGKIPKEDYWKIRKQIRSREFRSLSHMKERLRDGGLIE